jgi:hypothetical protein
MTAVVVGHDARDVDTEAFVGGQRSFETCKGAACLLIRQKATRQWSSTQMVAELPSDAAAELSIAPATRSTAFLLQ